MAVVSDKPRRDHVLESVRGRRLSTWHCTTLATVMNTLNKIKMKRQVMPMLKRRNEGIS
jgi:hypothetical protein